MRLMVCGQAGPWGAHASLVTLCCSLPEQPQALLLQIPTSPWSSTARSGRLNSGDPLSELSKSLSSGSSGFGFVPTPLLAGHCRCF